MWESSPRFSLLLFVPGSLHGRGYPRSIFFLAYIYSSIEVQPSARCCVTTSREEPLSKAVTYDLSVPVASFSTSFLPNGHRGFFSLSLSLFPISANTRNVFGESNTRYFVTRLVRYYLLVAYEIRIVAILLAEAEAEERLGTYSTWRKFSGGCNTSEIKEKSYAPER